MESTEPDSGVLRYDDDVFGAVIGIRKAQRGGRLAAAQVTVSQSLMNSIAIAFKNPRVGLGCIIRIINTAPQFGFLVLLPSVFADDLGYGTGAWLQLVFILGVSNIFANLLFGVLSDRLGWHRTLRWCGCFASAASTLCLYFVPQAFSEHFWVSVVCASFFGITLAGFTPISVLMSLIAPDQKGNAIAVLNLGAGAAMFVGPFIVTLFLDLTGAGGVTIIFAALYVLAGLSVHWLRLPEESQEIVEQGITIEEARESDIVGTPEK